jgi:hypothetical protein
MEKLVPYCFYIYQEHVPKMRALAKERKASPFVRDALTAAFDKTDEYQTGYNKALRDACDVIRSIREAKMMLVQEEPLDKFLMKQLRDLEV